MRNTAFSGIWNYLLLSLSLSLFPIILTNDGILVDEAATKTGNILKFVRIRCIVFPAYLNRYP